MDDPKDFVTWLQVAKCFKIWDLDARGYHKSMWRMHMMESEMLVIGVPNSEYAKYKPSNITPIYLESHKDKRKLRLPTMIQRAKLWWGLLLYSVTAYIRGVQTKRGVPFSFSSLVTSYHVQSTSLECSITPAQHHACFQASRALRLETQQRRKYAAESMYVYNKLHIIRRAGYQAASNVAEG
uniref:Uncharacterized protein n=1 Tax=Timema monikensis TaxID=170555 RepID=A0A7R9HJ36_9NEOP|nr:unnamed protein product [Timema monikensis]